MSLKVADKRYTPQQNFIIVIVCFLILIIKDVDDDTSNADIASYLLGVLIAFVIILVITYVRYRKSLKD